ncbi:MAG: AsmA family protein, partial [Bacteroidetes bacterium]
MNRVKKIAKWAFVLVLSLSILLFAAGLLFEEQIVKQLLSQLNEELTQPIEVEQASLSLLKDFPNASVSLSSVRLKDYRDSTLLNAGTIQFSFGLPSLINNEVVFDRIRIDQGELHLAIDKNGQPNYQILKTAPS